MADTHASSKPSNGVLSLVAFASVVAAAISGGRLYGERQGWNVPVLGKNLFSTDAGGGGSLLGVATLVPIFGFWFGRRLAGSGHGPSVIGTSLLLHLLGIAVAGGVIWASLEGGFFAGWKDKGLAFGIGTSVAGLFALMAWPRAWGANVFFGLLSRAPIALIQFVAIEKGWNTHYSKAHPDIPKDPDSTLFALTLAQATFWPLAFTTLVGGLFATIGAATVRRS